MASTFGTFPFSSSMINYQKIRWARTRSQDILRLSFFSKLSGLLLLDFVPFVDANILTPACRYMGKPRSQNSGFITDFQFLLTMKPNFRYMDKPRSQTSGFPLTFHFMWPNSLLFRLPFLFPTYASSSSSCGLLRGCTASSDLNSTIDATKYKG